MKIKNTNPTGNYTSTNNIKYVGKIPTCALTGDCSIDETDLTYLISILLQRYCGENNVIDADLSSVDISCLIASNPDIQLPENITIETLSTYYKNHICTLYSQISDLKVIVDSLAGIYCLNDIVQLDQDSSIIIDPLFNDMVDGVTGNVVLSILDNPINGTATISTNKITYVGDVDFFGNDQITYKVVKGSYTCTAKISIKVNQVISEQTITDIVVEQITTILQSNEYWDLGLEIGTKLSVTQDKLASFNLVGGAWGKGVANSRYSKWAICNGNNGTDDERGVTTRGYDINDNDYDDASPSNLGGSDSIAIGINNIPPHRHKYFDAFTNACDGTSCFSSSVDGHALALGVNQGTITVGLGEISEGDTSDRDSVWYDRNTGDGTDNISGAFNQGALKSSPDSLNIRNKYFTEIKIQKIL